MLPGSAYYQSPPGTSEDSVPENDDPRHHYAQDQVSKVRYVYLGLQARWVTQSRHAHIETGHEARCLHCTGCDEQLLEAPCRSIQSRIDSLKAASR